MKADLHLGPPKWSLVFLVFVFHIIDLQLDNLSFNFIEEV